MQCDAPLSHSMTHSRLLQGEDPLETFDYLEEKDAEASAPSEKSAVSNVREQKWRRMQLASRSRVPEPR